jgi:hypothetical protein
MELPSCAEEFTRYYQVPHVLVQSIFEVEAGWAGARVGPDKNGNFTLGLMQVNSLWFDHTLGSDLKRYGITPEQVQHDECTNLAMAVWLLREQYRRTGDWSRAVAQLHAGPLRWKEAIPHAHDVFRRLEQRQ